ncbi:hypothetical protein EDEG_03435 [Edhazardia aedis USNM 41457]|uniref:Uncharacterized protein n=1 Tax=Edhazardia aedis (strain USNM 41457) TaxID=1003232 RepID=J9DL87_EDHAE|nr:hypothetical protein EDEG_03435 [Edhazardia aedis USNM 41457]|eukprot:EJW02117.1 hypothetical protein EDEG_03435 [Edhazardia aedis USNM 41457]
MIHKNQTSINILKIFASIINIIKSSNIKQAVDASNSPNTAENYEKKCNLLGNECAKAQSYESSLQNDKFDNELKQKNYLWNADYKSNHSIENPQDDFNNVSNDSEATSSKSSLKEKNFV